MQIGVAAEVTPGEARVAATPDTVSVFLTRGHTCLIQSGAGSGASLTDASYRNAGADLASSAAEVYAAADIVLKVRRPDAPELRMLRQGSVLVGLLEPHDDTAIERLAATGVIAFAMEALPRITRAQPMDVLSSQAGIAGYKAVLLAANEYRRLFPMLMTAAGTVKAARVLVLGAGVAGLQAIATARRLGAIVEAFDVRPAARQEVESLGARFVEVPASERERSEAQTAGGYAREMSEAYRQRQAALVAERTAAADIVITTALMPGRRAPLLVTEEMVARMKPGSVIVDLAAAAGGNCALTERDRVIVRHEVRIVGHSNVPALVAADASSLYARNLLNFVELLADPATGALRIDTNDEIVASTMVCRGGVPARARGTSVA